MKRKLFSALIAGALLLCSACGTVDDPKHSGTAPSSSGTTSVPPATEPTVSTELTEDVEPFIYEFDPYVISPEYAELYGEDFIEVCRGLTDAFIAYEKECHCPDEETFSALLGCVDVCMPFFASDAVLTYDSFDADRQTITIHYLSSSVSAHNEAYGRFVAAVSAFIEPVIAPGDSKLERAVSVYRNFTSSITYDLSTDDVSAHGAIMKRSGIAHSFAGACAYLFRQAGIDANTVGGLSSDGTAAHEWVVFSLDGKNYYADPTYENGETGGFGLSYFGTNDAERAEAGYNVANCRVGTTGRIFASELGANHTDLELFRGTTAFEMDRVKGIIILSNGTQTAVADLPGGRP